MTRFFAIATAITVLFASCGKDTSVGVDTVNDADRTFAATAGSLYKAHRDFSKIAYDGGQDSMVIRLAEQVFLTSDNAYLDLIELSKMKGIVVSGNLDDEHIAWKSQLEGLSGRALDSTYLHMLVIDQHHLLAAYDVLKQTGNNATLMSHANRFSDTMLTYHEQADSLADLY